MAFLLKSSRHFLLLFLFSITVKRYLPRLNLAGMNISLFEQCVVLTYRGIWVSPNPFKYQRLCVELKNDWDKIRNHFHLLTDGQSFRISRIHIRKEYNDKHIFKMNYKNWRVDGNPESDLLMHEKGPSRFIVRADISTCFPSIYTHSIPWALVGKEKAKQTVHDDTWYNRIDQACSDMRNGETHGLLIGPHTSNLISEIILTVVDKRLYDKGYA